MTGAGWVALGAKPGGVSSVFVDGSGRIYFADPIRHRIVRIDDLTGSGWTTFGTKGTGRGQLDEPSDVFVDTAGRIYVADWGNQRIVRIDDMKGTGWIATRGGPAGKQFGLIRRVFVDKGGRIYAADEIYVLPEDRFVDRLIRIDDMGGSGWVVYQGDGEKEFGAVGSVAVDTAGRIYVTDPQNGRVVRMNNMAGGGWLAVGTRGHGTSQLARPNGIFVDPVGRIYVTDPQSNRIALIDDMDAPAWVTFGTKGRGANQFENPKDLFVDHAGHIYVADSGNSRIVRLNNIAESAEWSGRWDLNPRPSAWEADALPLSYTRSLPEL